MGKATGEAIARRSGHYIEKACFPIQMVLLIEKKIPLKGE